MRIVLSDFMSLDGVVQAPGGPGEDTEGGFAHGGWSMPYFDVEVMGGAIDEAMKETRALLFGRRTWQTMAAAWPERAGTDPFADHMNAITKYVASTTLTEADMTWNNSTLLPADNVLGAVADLRASGEGDMHVMGSSVLARSLVENGLVDEYRLMISPVLLGGGKRMFPEDGVARHLRLVSHTVASTGTQVCVFRPADAD
ncbi:dihydrofolate reductase family protein [Streptomyces sp. ST2-7A]|uniref:dihydrofolate reductase family protein n=1 Tax=Streptomyces sp. ST2-7A TaxID=2907214 RepID=UPI001F33F1F8|nr:dihydrofolate reductase family protein [Streptomyces sp. ST2-7A]MCE7080641.1 dihydrofolate reductase family protein [Streptomyces sp. ST2-7A]